jgi:hypothetical protein
MRIHSARRSVAASFRPLLLLASLGACSADGSASLDPATQLPGTYALRSVGGSALPVAVAHGGEGRLDLVAASRTLMDDGSYTEAYDYRYVTSAPGDTVAVKRDAAGAYRAAGNTVVFTDATDGTRVEAAVAPGGLSLVHDGRRYEYRK